MRIDPGRVRDITTDLVRINSIVATPGEARIGRWVYQQLKTLPYFQSEGSLRLIKTHDDEHERYLVMALVKGKARKEAVCPGDTVILLGHTDTVGIDDYHALRPWALEPQELARRLSALPDLSPDLAGDLESGEWLFGRGALDMKSGVASHMAILEYLTRRTSEMAGNVLFIATPDEEDMSHGILTAQRCLIEMAKSEGLRYVAAINADCTSPLYPGDPNRYIYMGSVGKVLPSFFITGKETHVGQPFEGFDPNLLASELTRLIDLNPELSDEGLGEVTAPPVSLKQADLKGAYTVQTPVSTYAYYNFFTHSKSPGDVLDVMLGVARKGFQNVIQIIRQRSEEYSKRTGKPRIPCPWEVRVFTWERFYALLLEEHGDAFREAMETKAREMLDDPSIDLRIFSLRVVEEAWSWTSDKSPCVILYFSSAFSPRVVLTGDRPEERRLMDAVTSALEDVPGEYEMEVRRFFPYISDMSFLSMNEDEEGIMSLARNMPAWGSKYVLDPSPILALNIPVVNIGSYGKDAHKMTERVHMPYTFGVMPEITLRVVESLIGLT